MPWCQVKTIDDSPGRAKALFHHNEAAWYIQRDFSSVFQVVWSPQFSNSGFKMFFWLLQTQVQRIIGKCHASWSSLLCFSSRCYWPERGITWIKNTLAIENACIWNCGTWLFGLLSNVKGSGIKRLQSICKHDAMHPLQRWVPLHLGCKRLKSYKNATPPWNQ